MKRDLTERVENRIISSSLVKKISAPLDALLNRCFQTTALHPLKILLNGSWLGHPLHPLLTDIPIGAWTLSCSGTTTWGTSALPKPMSAGAWI